MSIGLTLGIGFYGVVGALYSEFLKPTYEQSGQAIAIDFVVGLLVITGSIESLKFAYKEIKATMRNDHEKFPI